MGRMLNGTSRVHLAPFTVSWEDQGQCVLAYAREGGMGIVAAVQVPEVPYGAPSLWDVAARHLPTNTTDQDEAYGRWLLCAGWSRSVLPDPNGLDLTGEAWTVNVSKTAMLKAPAYGSDGVYVGYLWFDNPAVNAKAQGLLGVTV
ncbi:hypothetical protein [Streptomyces sp. CBMA152]|uniref:hypothetical protein n=1 Tax=Streptomyces sp. CBMA152 TaxID=1896312 RepID=UPI0016601756|nr:hypothetical protein [Streptomyces sp. CBMA152]MBD0743545.1 hypothetical protein [Streptomyces sp. CBMA152]